MGMIELLDDGTQHRTSRGTIPDIAERAFRRTRPPTPDYLQRHYWWAYIHPRAVAFFERPWLTNLILLGNYHRLATEAVDAIQVKNGGRVLQVACAYGELTPLLAKKLEAAGGELDVIDVLPIQLVNLFEKLETDSPVRLSCMDSRDLQFREETFESVLLFFLMHEQPDPARRATLREAERVLKKGGKLVIVDYARPSRWNPFRYLMQRILQKLEPFALDLWVGDATRWLPAMLAKNIVQRRTFFGGMYQAIEIIKQ